MKINHIWKPIRHAAMLLGMMGLFGAFAPQAQAAVTPPAISIADNAGNVITIDSTGAATPSGACTLLSCTTVTTVGICAVNWTGTLGSNTFSLCGSYFLFGTPAVVPYLDINVSGLIAAAPGTLTVKLTNVNVSAAPLYTMNVLETSAAGLNSAAYTAYADPSNTPFSTTGTAVLLGALNTSGTLTNLSGPSGRAMSITNQVVLNLAAGADYSVDFYQLPSPDVSSSCPAVSATQNMAIAPVTIVPSGGIGPYTISASGLPAGLSVINGTLQGTPTQSGAFNYTLALTDLGDNNNVTTANCSITVSQPVTSTPIAHGDAATIGFWHNKNGQALIDALNGGPTATALGNWLAAQFPYLYGPQSSNNMTGKANTTVAALFMAFFGQGGQKTSAQVMAGALATYVTSTTLGGATAGGYGFNMSAAGTGSKSYNVGSLGTSIGLANNTSYTVLQLLQQANLTQQNHTYNANAFNVIFSGINQTGDIN
jgi:hypothetical protein